LKGYDHFVVLVLKMLDDDSRIAPPILPPPTPIAVGLSDDEREAVTTQLHHLVESMTSSDDVDIVSVHAASFKQAIDKLGIDLDTGVISHILDLLLRCATSDFTQRFFLRLLIDLAHHATLPQYLISSGAVEAILHHGCWSDPFPGGKILVLELLSVLLLQGEYVVEYFIGLDFVDFMCDQFAMITGTLTGDFDSLLFLRELMKGASNCARFAHLLRPPAHCQLLAIADHILTRPVVFCDLISEALNILRFFIGSDSVDIDLILQYAGLPLVIGFFEAKYAGHLSSLLYVMGSCTRRVELMAFATSINVIELTEKLVSGRRRHEDLAGFCFFLSGYLALDSTAISPLIHRNFFEFFVSLVKSANVEAQRQFADVLVTVLRFVDADDVSVLMSASLWDFFFKVLGTSSELSHRFIESFWELCRRCVGFWKSNDAFIAGLTRLLEDFPNDLSDVVEAVLDVVTPEE
jgi:hypothetical protein